MPPLTRLVRDPHPPSEKGPLLVLLHGLGSNEQDLMHLAPELPSELRTVTLRAPLTTPMGGFAWFQIQWGPTGIIVDPNEILASVEHLVEELAALRAEYSPSRFLLGGFSQGAIMTLGCVARRPELFDGGISMSGRFVPELLAGAPAELANVPFLVQHGVYDEVLPVEGSRQIADSLRQRGVSVESHEYPMAHEVSWPSLQHLKAWIERTTHPIST